MGRPRVFSLACPDKHFWEMDMEKLGDMLIRKKPFQEMVMGNTAVVRAMVEAGTQVVTSYPGSPTPEIATAINSIPEEKRPFYFEFHLFPCRIARYHEYPFQPPQYHPDCHGKRHHCHDRTPGPCRQRNSH